MTMIPKKGALIAAAVAGLFGCAGTSAVSGNTRPPAQGSASVQCGGVNACKAQGSCAGNENACKAKNSCRGKGWVEAPSAADCRAQGGTVLDKKS